MRKIINKKLYDTETAKYIAYKHVGDFGQPDGYEEQLYVKKTGEYFLYGIGGPESKYSAPAVNPITARQAKEWRDNNVKMVA